MTIRKIIVTKPFIRLVAAWLIITAAVFGVCAECGGEGGMYQGGGDSAPGWRR